MAINASLLRLPAVVDCPPTFSQECPKAMSSPHLGLACPQQLVALGLLLSTSSMQGIAPREKLCQLPTRQLRVQRRHEPHILFFRAGVLPQRSHCRTALLFLVVTLPFHLFVCLPVCVCIVIRFRVGSGVPASGMADDWPLAGAKQGTHKTHHACSYHKAWNPLMKLKAITFPLRLFSVCKSS